MTKACGQAATALLERRRSCSWGFGPHKADPNLIFAGGKYGHLLRSDDVGHTWSEDWREFSEIIAIAWVPVAAERQAAH